MFKFVLLNGQAQTIFTPEYQGIIARTPHLKDRPPTSAWIAFAMLVLLLGTAVVLGALDS